MSRRDWIFPSGPGPCSLCASANLREWTQLHTFPTSDVGTLPYTLDGSTVAGTTILGTITSDGSSFGQSAGPWAFSDASVIIFPLVRRDFAMSYEYTISAGGKHWINVMSGTDLATYTFIIGSWSNDASNTIPIMRSGNTSTSINCVEEYPIPELDGLLPQTSGVWRARTISKINRSITFTDGAVGPISFSRCYVPTRGYISLTLGPGVRIRNLSISAV